MSSITQLDNELISFLETYLTLENLKLSSILEDIFLLSQSRQKNISIQEEKEYQTSLFDGISYPITLNYVELMMALEKKFEIVLNDDDEFNTVKDLCDCIKNRISHK